MVKVDEAEEGDNFEFELEEEEEEEMEEKKTRNEFENDVSAETGCGFVRR